jgi:hypothetical protein
VGSSPALLSVFRDPATLQPNILGWIAMFAPLIFVFVLGGAVNRVSASALQTMFYVFSALMGLSMAWIFAAFTGVSIAQTFLATSIAFAACSLYGYTTKRDLGPMGAFLMIGLIGLLVVMIINIFVASSALAFAVSVIGVPDLRGPHRLRHAAHQDRVRGPRRAWRLGVAGQVGDPRRAEPVPELHQHLYVPAVLHGQPRVSLTGT